MPNKINLRKWTTALRSGQFKQGRGHLATTRLDGSDPRYCCLGVACQLLAEEDDNFASKTRTGRQIGAPNTFIYLMYAGGNRSTLPLEVREWLGIDTSDPRVTAIGQFSRLTSINDVRQESFSSIADMIDKQYNLYDEEGRPTD